MPCQWRTLSHKHISALEWTNTHELLSHDRTEQERFFTWRTAGLAVNSSSITFFAQMLLEEQRCALLKCPKSHPCRGPGHSGFPFEHCVLSLFCFLDLLSCRILLSPYTQPLPQHCNYFCAEILCGWGRGFGSCLEIPLSSYWTSYFHSSWAPSASHWSTLARVCRGSHCCVPVGPSCSLLRGPPSNGLTKLCLENHSAVRKSSFLFPNPGKAGWSLEFQDNFLITV